MIIIARGDKDMKMHKLIDHTSAAEKVGKKCKPDPTIPCLKADNEGTKQIAYNIPSSDIINIEELESDYVRNTAA